MNKNKVMNVRWIGLPVVLFFCLSWLPKVNHAEEGEDKKQKISPLPAQKEKKKIIFIAGACSHGKGEHEHSAGTMLLANELKKTMSSVVDIEVFQLWPSDTTVLDNAATIVMYMDGGGGHLSLKHMAHMDRLMKKGVGLVCLHYAVEVPKERGGPEFTSWLGGYFETYWSVNPHWEAQFQSLPNHPVTAGVKPFTMNDEWYYHMRFPDKMKGVTPILTDIPPASTLERKDGPHEGNEFVRAEQGKPQHVAWVVQRKDGGRGFGYTGGHFHKNWGNPDARKLVLNSILWTAKLNVPKNGVPVSVLSADDLQANLDVKPCKR
ncbi:MAG: ThuA domain-containing protein [Saprospiraceae bacterium]|nr:ThuA domain-containing protein [Saprospiraceae bacterium]